MSVQARPNWYQAKPRQNDLKEIWVAGYGMTLITDFTPDLDQQDDSLGVFGYSGTIDTKIISAGTLALSGIFDATMQVLFDVESDVDPRTTGIKANYPKNAFLDIVRLTKDPTKKYYETVEIFPKVSFAIVPSGGGPKEKPTFNFSGRCDVPLQMVAAPGKGLAITWDLVALADAGNNSLTGDFADVNPTRIPTNATGYENAGKYALTLEVQKRTGTTGIVTISSSAHLPVTSTNVSTGASKGRITIGTNDLLGTGIAITDTNQYAHVCYIREVTPDNSTLYLLGEEINSRGRFDWPAALT
jgi:hypothetical protein